jgi:signal transduction histidine kinase
MPDHGTVIGRGRLRALLVLGLLGYAGGLVVLASIATASSPAAQELVHAAVLLLPTIGLGVLVVWRRPDSPVGPALVALAAAPCLTWAVEQWGASYGNPHTWPGLAIVFVSGGVWVFNLAGFVLLCLVFPDGRLRGRFWAALPWAYLAVAAAVIAVIGLDPVAYRAGGGPLPGSTPVPLGDAGFRVLDAVVGLVLLAVLGGAAGSLVVRYRRGDDLVRVQLRWLMLGAGSVPVLLGAGWMAQAAGAPVDVAYGGFIVAVVVVVPATVAVAILRHDLLDVDRLLGGTVSWLITTLVSAAAFALVVLAVAQIGSTVDDRVGITVAAFVVALVLLPLHRRVHEAVGRVLDRERTVMVSRVRQFVRQVRDGQAQPEEVQDALRASLGDPALLVLLRLPGADGYVDLTGTATGADPDPARLIPLTARDSEVGALVLGRASARRRRQAREAAVEARLPIEVSRLRLELRRALDDARASRSRLVEAVADERRRLERDLHDGAQQRILAVGMRLRSVQRRHRGDPDTDRDLDAAVAALEATVAELRRLAHGVRPSRLDDGLDAAIRDLVHHSPVPVDLAVTTGGTELSEAVATTAYYVVAECLANALKHAGATRVSVSIAPRDGRLAVRVSDDGRGGADTGFGLTALRDRVGALGGRVEIASPTGGGTTVRAEI